MDYRVLSQMAAQAARMAARTSATPATTDFSPATTDFSPYKNFSTRIEDNSGGGGLSIGANAPSSGGDTALLLQPDVAYHPTLSSALLDSLDSLNKYGELARQRSSDLQDRLNILLNEPGVQAPQRLPYGGITRDSALAVGSAALIGKLLGVRDRFLNAGVQGYVGGQKAEADAQYADQLRGYAADVADRQRKFAAIKDALSSSGDEIKDVGNQRNDLLKILSDLDIAGTKAESSKAVADTKTPGAKFTGLLQALVDAGIDPNKAGQIATSKYLKDLADAEFANTRSDRMKALLGPERAKLLSQAWVNESRVSLNAATANLQNVLARLKPAEFAEVMRMHTFEMADKNRRFGLDAFKADNGGGMTPGFEQDLMRNDAFIKVAPEQIKGLEDQIKQWKSAPAGETLNAQQIADAQKAILDIKAKVSQAEELKRIAGAGSDPAGQRPSFRDYQLGDGSKIPIEDASGLLSRLLESANGNSNDDQSRAIAVQTAKSYEGTKYVWGGRSPKGVDCSGLVCQVYNSMGYDVSGTADSMYRSLGRKVEMSEELEPGDVLFFDFKKTGKATHTGIYAGNGMITHASGSSGVVKTVPLRDLVGGWIGTRRVIGAAKRTGVTMRGMKGGHASPVAKPASGSAASTKQGSPAPKTQPTTPKNPSAAQSGNVAPTFSDLIKNAGRKSQQPPTQKVSPSEREANQKDFDAAQALRKKTFLDKTKKARNG